MRKWKVVAGEDWEKCVGMIATVKTVFEVFLPDHINNQTLGQMRSMNGIVEAITQSKIRWRDDWFKLLTNSKVAPHRGLSEGQKATIQMTWKGMVVHDKRRTAHDKMTSNSCAHRQLTKSLIGLRGHISISQSVSLRKINTCLQHGPKLRAYKIHAPIDWDKGLALWHVKSCYYDNIINITLSLCYLAPHNISLHISCEG